MNITLHTMGTSVLLASAVTLASMPLHAQTPEERGLEIATAVDAQNDALAIPRPA